MGDTPTFVIFHPPGYDAERAYAFEVVLGTILGVRHVAREERRADVAIGLEGAPGERLCVADVLFATPPEVWLTAAMLPQVPLAREDDLPLLYAMPRAPNEESAQAWLGLDVFGSAFFLLTRYEELVSPERDAHERFPAAASIAVREGFLTRPIVHEYAELLWRRLAGLWPRLTRRQRAGELRPSHDVDWPALPARPLRAVVRTLAGDLIVRRDPRLACDRARWEHARRHGRLEMDPYDTFDELMDVSEAAGVRSAFYFLADGSYPLDEVAPVLRRVHERGHEIGLHPGYGSFRRPEAIAEQFRTLRETCWQLGIEQETWGGRQHFLQWENPVTWQAWDDAGLDYDATLTYSDRAGFRTGVCIEHPVFNLRTRRRLRLRERPLVAMEGALLGGVARRRHAEATLLALRAQCRRVGGDFTLLWHNSSLLSRRDRELYRRVVLE